MKKNKFNVISTFLLISTFFCPLLFFAFVLLCLLIALLFSFETRSHCADQAGLEPLFLVPQSTKGLY